MKKLLFLLLIVVGLSSCEEPNIKKSDLPIEVVTLKDNQKFDTVLVIETEKKLYQFTKNKEYIGVTDKINESFSIPFLITFILTIVFFGLFISYATD